MGQKKKKPVRPNDPSRPQMWRATVPPALNDKEQRVQWGLPEDESQPGDYMVELNLLFRDGLIAAKETFEQLYRDIVGREADEGRRAVPVSKSYYRCKISVLEWQELVARDETRPDARDRCIYKIWPDFPRGEGLLPWPRQATSHSR